MTRKSNAFLAALNLAALGLWLMSASGCTSERKETTDCGLQTEAECTDYKLADGDLCAYNSASKKCEAQTKTDAKKREELSTRCKTLDEALCKADKECTHTAAGCDAAAVGLAGTCPAIQAEKACDDDAECDWADGSCKATVTAVNAYKWERAALPTATAALTDVTNVVASGNGHIYVMSKEVGNEGLYHSADGKAFAKLADLTAKAKASALDVTIALAGGLNEMKATSVGLVVRQGKKVAILVGDKAELVLDAELNHTATVGGPGVNDRVPSISDNDISFIDVVTTALGETVVFGQNDDQKIFFHSATANFEEEPKVFRTMDGASKLNQKWIRVGNAANGDLLLMSKNGVWRVLAANATTDATVADAGKVTQKAELIRARTTAGKAWQKATNNTPNFVTSLDDTNYLVGLRKTVVGAGGLAHGIAGAEEALDFVDHNVTAIVKRDGKTYVATDKGLKAINNDGTADAANNYKLEALDAANNKMVDGSALSFRPADSENVRGVYGDAAKQIIWVKGEGIYVVTKK